MEFAPEPHSTAAPAPARRRAQCSAIPWTRIAAAGTLIAGGGLLLSGKRKAGLVAATAGASLALLDQQEVVSEWWDSLPGNIGKVQKVLGQVQETLDDVVVQREKLAKLLNR
jgi:hypothetical protein